MIDDHPKRYTIFLSATLFLALAIRLLYISQVIDTIIFPWLATDTAYFDQVAQRILRGELSHPDNLFLNPFYPFFLSGIYGIFGHNPLAVIIVQALLDTANCWLLAGLTAAVAGRRASLLAALLYAGYGMAVFYSGLLLAPTLAIFFSLSGLVLLIRAQRYGRIAWIAAAGVIFGLLVLTRTNAVLFLPAVPIWLFWIYAGQHGFQKATFAMICFALGCGSILALNASRNAYYHGTFHPFSVQGGINFYIGNNPEANGILTTPHGISATPVKQVKASINLAQVRSGQPLTPFQASTYWLHQGLDYLRSHPMEAAGLYAKKMGLFWRKEEITLNINYPLCRQTIPILKSLPLFSFGLAAPLAIMGMVASLRRFRRRFLPLAYLTIYMCSVVLFFMSDRYRLPAAPLLIMFAAIFLARAIDTVCQKKWRQCCLTGIVLILAAFFINFEFSAADAASDGLSFHYNNMGLAYKRKGDLAAAASNLEKALHLHPHDASAMLNLGSVLVDKGDYHDAEKLFRRAIALQPHYAEAHYNMGVLQSKTDNRDAAIKHYRQTLLLDPCFSQAHTNLAILLLDQGRTRAAQSHLSKALELDPDRTEALIAMGRVHTGRKEFKKALNCFRRALTLSPDNIESHVNMGAICTMENQLDLAVTYYEKALALDPGVSETHFNLAAALARMGRVQKARHHFQQALKINPSYWKARIGLGMLEAAQGQLDQAAACFETAAQMAPDSVEPLKYLYQVRVSQGDQAAAENILMRIQKINRTGD